MKSLFSGLFGGTGGQSMEVSTEPVNGAASATTLVTDTTVDDGTNVVLTTNDGADVAVEEITPNDSEASGIEVVEKPQQQDEDAIGDRAKKGPYKRVFEQPLDKKAHEWLHSPVSPGGLVPIGFCPMETVRVAANVAGGCTDTPGALEPCDFVRLRRENDGESGAITYIEYLQPLVDDVLDRILQEKGGGVRPQSREELVDLLTTQDGYRRVKLGEIPEVALYLMVIHQGLSVEDALNALGFTEERLEQRLRIKPLTLEELQILVCPDGSQPVMCSYAASQGKNLPFMPLKGAIIDPKRARQRQGGSIGQKLTDLIVVNDADVQQWLGCAVEFFDPASGEKRVETIFGTAIFSRPSRYVRGTTDVPPELFRRQICRAKTMFDGTPNALGLVCQELYELREQHDKGFKKHLFRHLGFANCDSISCAVENVQAFNQARHQKAEQKRVDREAQHGQMSEGVKAFVGGQRRIPGNSPFAAAGKSELGSATDMTQFSQLLTEASANAELSGAGGHDSRSRREKRREEERRRNKDRRRGDGDDE